MRIRHVLAAAALVAAGVTLPTTAQADDGDIALSVLGVGDTNVDVAVCINAVDQLPFNPRLDYVVSSAGSTVASGSWSYDDADAALILIDPCPAEFVSFGITTLDPGRDYTVDVTATLVPRLSDDPAQDDPDRGTRIAHASVSARTTGSPASGTPGGSSGGGGGAGGGGGSAGGGSTSPSAPSSPSAAPSPSASDVPGGDVIVIADPASLTAVQLAALSPEQVASIAPETFGRLRPATVKALRPAQAARLTAAHTASLLPAGAAALRPATVAALRRDALRALRPVSVKFLTPAAVGAMSRGQLAALTPRQVAALRPKQLAVLSRAERALLHRAPPA